MKTRTFAIIIIAGLLLAGCAMFGPTAEEKAQAAALVDQMEQNSTAINGFQSNIDETQRRIDEIIGEITTGMTPEQINTIEDKIAEWQGSIDGFQGSIDEVMGENEQLASQIETLMSPDTPVDEALGTGLQMVGQLLGGPWGTGIGLVGGSIAFGARERRRGNQRRSVTRARNGDGTIDWEKAGALQDRLGIRSAVRAAADSITMEV
jgi:ClpP class serine protease